MMNQNLILLAPFQVSGCKFICVFQSLMQHKFTFSERLMNDIAEEIFNYLDYDSLKNSEAVSKEWHDNILFGKTWKRLLERNVIVF